MKLLIVTPDRNQQKQDFDREFRPRAKQLEDAVSGSVTVRFRLGPRTEKGYADRRKTILSAIREHEPEHVALFTHGLQQSLPQLGWHTGNLGDLAEALAEVSTAPKVILYACSAAGGPGTDGDRGFVDELRDELCRRGAIWCKVWGHATPGVASTNPWWRLCAGAGKPEGGVGGRWVIAPHSKLWARWQEEIGRTLWREFPFMSQIEIEERLGG